MHLGVISNQQMKYKMEQQTSNETTRSKSTDVCGRIPAVILAIRISDHQVKVVPKSDQNN